MCVKRTQRNLNTDMRTMRDHAAATAIAKAMNTERINAVTDTIIMTKMGMKSTSAAESIITMMMDMNAVMGIIVMTKMGMKSISAAESIITTMMDMNAAMDIVTMTKKIMVSISVAEDTSIEAIHQDC